MDSLLQHRGARELIYGKVGVEGKTMVGKWLIADRDLNEREGLKWLLKSSSIPVENIFLAGDFQEFIMLFEQKVPDVVLLELDMINKDDWISFRNLVHIFSPVLVLTSAEATFEKARLAIDLQALDLIIKPFSTTKVKTAYQKAAQKLQAKVDPFEMTRANTFKDEIYEAFFLKQSLKDENFQLAAFQIQNEEAFSALHSFLSDYPFKGLQAVFPLSDLILMLFSETCQTMKEQCLKAMGRWEEEFSEPLAIALHAELSPNVPLKQKYQQIQQTLELTYYKGYRQVLEFEAVVSWEHIDPFLTPPEQRTWINMLTNFENNNIKNWLYEEFLHLSAPYPDPGLVRIRLTSILAQIRRFMKTYHLELMPVFEREYRTIFDSILYDRVLYRTVQNLILFIQKIFTGVKNSTSSLKQDPIERGLAYMEAHFTKNELKLDDVAHYVERNPAYFSHLLLTKTGSSFTNVLTNMRMKEAKRLLLESSKPIREIAILVGYQDANYFSRIFKDRIGMSPREFRKYKPTDE